MAKRVKRFKGWSIYQATTDNDRIGFDNCDFAAFLPEESPQEFFSPEWCADNIAELLDFIRNY